MVISGNRLFCQLDGLTPEIREQRRVAALEKLGLLEAKTVPVFDEATQTAARFVETPLCILGLMENDSLWLKSAVGLSNLGLMNLLAVERKIPRRDSFCTYVIDSQRNLVIDNALTNPVFASSTLVQHYGICAYLGTPLITSEGECIGTLAVMDTEPRVFTNKDLEFLALTARWCIKEYERSQALKVGKSSVRGLGDQALIAQSQVQQAVTQPHNEPNLTPSQASQVATDEIKVKLLEQLITKLRTPLTSIIGMASVLQRQVYGSLTNKQKEYLGVIHNSGQSLLSLVKEIDNLGVFDENGSKLQLSAVDLEMLCQQVIISLGQKAESKQHELRLSVEPGHRIWSLDKDKVKQALYYLLASVIESAQEGAIVRVHVSRKSQTIDLAVWVSHPWLGNGLSEAKLFGAAITARQNPPFTENLAEAEHFSHTQTAIATGNQRLFANFQFREVSNGSAGNFQAIEAAVDEVDFIAQDLERDSGNSASSFQSQEPLTSWSVLAALNQAMESDDHKLSSDCRQLLELLLSCHLVELHQGQITVQRALQSGDRYVIQLPKIAVED